MIDVSLHASERKMEAEIREASNPTNGHFQWLKVETQDGGVAIFATTEQLAQIRDTINEYLDKQEVAP